ncbi:helix-turn-helix domain-containing protein [Streptomyces sp. NPDC002564]
MTPGAGIASTDPEPAGHQGHFARLLHHIRQHAATTVNDLVHATGTDPDHLHQVLAGHRFPTQAFTRRYARACGADPHILLMAWQHEHDRRTRAGRPD